MTRPAAGRVALVAAIMVGVGAIVCTLINFLAILAGIENIPRIYLLPDPVGWPFYAGRTDPGRIAASLIGIVLLVGLTWLFVFLVARAAAAGRAAAVFFGTWGALILAGAISSTVRAPILLATFGFPLEQVDLIFNQFIQISNTGVIWGLNWGWLTALVAAIVHTVSTRASASVARPAAPDQHQQGTPAPGQSFPPTGAPGAEATHPYEPPAPDVTQPRP